MRDVIAEKLLKSVKYYLLVIIATNAKMSEQICWKKMQFLSSTINC